MTGKHSPDKPTSGDWVDAREMHKVIKKSLIPATISRNTTILEIGPGPTPLLAQKLHKDGARMFAIDNNAATLASAQQAGCFQGTSHSSVQDLAAGNPFTERFDAVVMSGVAGYLSREDRAKMIHGIRHHCMKDRKGAFIVTVPPILVKEGEAYPADEAEYVRNELKKYDTAQRVYEGRGSIEERASVMAEELKYAEEERNAPREKGLLRHTLQQYFGKVISQLPTGGDNLDEIFIASNPKPLNQCPSQPLTDAELDTVVVGKRSKG